MSKIVPIEAQLNPLAQMLNRDIIAELLQEKRSLNTRHAYGKDLKDFFQTVASSSPTPEVVGHFLALERFEAVALVLQYKRQMINRGLKEATVNRRLSAIKSLVSYARKLGKCNYTLEDVKGEKVQKYRDTTGIGRDVIRLVLAVPNRETLKGKRDYALLRLLWDNALRRGEVVSADIRDFEPEAKRMKIRGKGRGTSVEVIDLAASTVQAVCEWLGARGELRQDAPLFIALDNANKGHRLTGSAIYWIVEQACQAAGVGKQMSPHRLRHSSITAALDATDGNVRKVQKLSRHRQIDTLMIYDDNRSQDQREISELLAELA